MLQQLRWVHPHCRGVWRRPTAARWGLSQPACAGGRTVQGTAGRSAVRVCDPSRYLEPGVELPVGERHHAHASPPAGLLPPPLLLLVGVQSACQAAAAAATATAAAAAAAAARRSS